MSKRRYLDELLDEYKDYKRCPAEFINFMGISDHSAEYAEVAWQLAQETKRLPAEKQVLLRLAEMTGKAPGLRQDAAPSYQATLWAKTTFEGLHCHPTHPLGAFSWLTGWHRHIFHVEVGIPYTPHIEGHELKDSIEKLIHDKWHKKQMDKIRVYEIALAIMTEFKAAYVIVSEEGEVGCCLIASEGE